MLTRMKLPVAVVLLLTIATATILPAFARRELQNDDSDDDGDRGRDMIDKTWQV